MPRLVTPWHSHSWLCSSLQKQIISPTQLTRRSFLSGITAATLLLSRGASFAFPEQPRYPFEQIPPEKSGIRWVHRNGKSPEKYLPETTGAGCAFLDYDNDGNLDLFLANGNPDDLITSLHGEVAYEQPLILLQRTAKGFQDVSAASGPVFAEKRSARGLAIGDFDNDGAVDVLVSINNGAPVLLKNNAAAGNHWLGLRLIGKTCNTDAIGARIAYQAGDLKRGRMKVGGGSYLSSHDPRVVLGIGKREKLDWLEIKWPHPSGKVERFTNLPLDRYITVVEGEGKWK